ncbi:biosynthetic-type acetolactate synthase large subunit [bacterium]|nr:biosynthetic-type acetolactate synthase large subunit [bacterium]
MSESKPKTRKKKTPTDTPCSKRGAEIIIDALEREGVEVVFGYPGGAVIDIFDLINQSNKFEFVLVRHEQGAMHMAEGYARATGKVGVVLVTSGPGATNTTTGLADAIMDSIPVVVISGQVASHLIGNDAFQEADVVGITRSVTKHNYLVKSIEELPQLIRNTFHIAQTGRPGPTLIDIPKDIQKQTLDEYVYPTEPDLPGYVVPSEPQTDPVNAAWELINACERPLLYVGGGVINANASDDLFVFATKTNIPVTTTLMGLGAFPESHPLSLKMLGMHGTVYANKAVQECDCLIAVGSRFDDRVTGKLAEFAPHAKIIHMDIDPSSISKNVKVDVDVVGDVKNILKKLNKKAKPCSSDEWLAMIDEWKNNHPLAYKDNEQSDLILPQKLIEMVSEMADEDVIVSTEVGQHQMWSAQYVNFTRPRTWLTSGGLGTMGYGFPAAIGAQMAYPDRQVICIAGDGSLQMNIQEMATAKYYNLPVKVIVLNNGWLGMVRQWQDFFYGKNYSGTDLTCAKPGATKEDSSPGDWMNAHYYPDFEKMAEAYGWWGRKIIKRRDLEQGIKDCFEADGPAILDVWVAREENVFPMVPAGASLSQMMEGMA